MVEDTSLRDLLAARDRRQGRVSPLQGRAHGLRPPSASDGSRSVASGFASSWRRGSVLTGCGPCARPSWRHQRGAARAARGAHRVARAARRASWSQRRGTAQAVARPSGHARRARSRKVTGLRGIRESTARGARVRSPPRRRRGRSIAEASEAIEAAPPPTPPRDERSGETAVPTRAGRTHAVVAAKAGCRGIDAAPSRGVALVRALARRLDGVRTGVSSEAVAVRPRGGPVLRPGHRRGEESALCVRARALVRGAARGHGRSEPRVRRSRLPLAPRHLRARTPRRGDAARFVAHRSRADDRGPDSADAERACTCSSSAWAASRPFLAAMAAERIGERDVYGILRRQALASLYLDRMVTPMLEPTEGELRARILARTRRSASCRTSRRGRCSSAGTPRASSAQPCRPTTRTLAAD